MENLLLLLNKISEVSPLGVFNQEVIVVQNPGMQHWLNLAIANERGISMNMCYALPAQYLWKLIRTLASEEDVPDQSPYSREVLTWRIYALLATNSLVEDSDFTPATRYWLSSSGNGKDFSSQENLKRYQLAEQMADLYEQYLIFRPQWLDSWQKDEISTLHITENKWQAKLWQLLIKQLAYNPVELLHNAIENIPAKLIADPLILPKRLSFFGINSMAPMWLTFINALSEYIEVDFFHLNPCFSYWGDIISEKQAMSKLSHWSNGVDDNHIFVGNPLLANLGQQGREFLALLQDYSTVDVELFVEASSNKNSHLESSDSNEQHTNLCILHRLQDDILLLKDATQSPEQLVDDSITIVSCHSALREVQALHDYLLHQFNDSAKQGNNSTDRLTPKDVLVMCPQIEQYAPYVNAVFTHGWQELNDEVPPLPCSIADRSAKDSDPLIAAFSELLTLPDSRFQVSQLLSFLRLPAVANKFSINDEDCEKITLWLEQASVHWGLDQPHKAKLLGENVSNSFTWQQGLSRLLRGFAFSDHDSIYQEQLLLPTVEGDDAILLGQLMLFIEQLQTFAQQLSTPRTAVDWQQFLLNQLVLLFDTSHFFTPITKQNKSAPGQLLQINHQQMNNQIENSLTIIEHAISSLVEYCTHAHFHEKIDLPIVVDFLNNHFSQGDASRQFMIGQVTFCSMLPMRSIPFKIIAVLGLNDGEFPRQRQPLGFDLMAQSPAMLGDRSRRGDDRYLFLEAIISAREALYLSYQGRNIKNNNEKQPSLVLKELMDYLTQGYGWMFSQAQLTDHASLISENKEETRNKIQLQQIPMQPFSEENYWAHNPSCTTKASFDANWFKLSQHNPVITSVDDSRFVIESEAVSLVSLMANDLIRFFQHPSKMFAQQALNLYLDRANVELDDVEPFSADYLESYLLKQQLLSASLGTGDSLVNSELIDEHSVDSFPNSSTDEVIHTAILSGKFPDLPTMQGNFDTWIEDTQLFSQEIIAQGLDNPQLLDCAIQLELPSQLQSQVSAQPMILQAKMPVKLTDEGGQLVFYRSSSAKAKDLFTLFLHQLILQVWQEQNADENLAMLDATDNQLMQVKSTCGLFFNAKSRKVEQYQIARIDNAYAQLIHFIEVYEKGQKQPLLLNGELGAQVFKQSRGKSIEMTQERFEDFWFGNDATPGFGDDPYIHYFWSQCPNIVNFLPELNALYQNIYQYFNKTRETGTSKSKGAK
jgi:exodeoxyribonuclease V gamma subunit